ncbi:MAG: sugar ABC transporter permease [Clostridia bacterium]|nr:sugar ABC transporter permease [Clostridia bacterium]
MMFLPGLIFLVVFNIIPLFGLTFVFYDYIPALGLSESDFVGFDNFRLLFMRPDFWPAIRNTFFIAMLKIVIGFPIPIIFALLMNEVRNIGVKTGIQTVVYLPNFISWVVMSGIIIDIFSKNTGLINNVIDFLGGERKDFLGSNATFVPVLILTDIWKSFGWGSVIYLSSLAAIDPTYYESAVIDGATRWKQTFAITLPSMLPIILLSSTLQLGNVLNAGFDQIFNLQNDLVLETSEIIDTLSYKMYHDDFNWSQSTLIGLMKSFVSMFFILGGWKLAKKFSGYSVF